MESKGHEVQERAGADDQASCKDPNLEYGPDDGEVSGVAADGMLPTRDLGKLKS